RVQRKDAEIIKNEFNCNMVRCSHYPQSPAFLDACDELGLLVWEEAPGWHNVSNIAAWQDAVLRDVRAMVTRDRSRPSVIIWGTRPPCTARRRARRGPTPGTPACWPGPRSTTARCSARVPTTSSGPG